MDVGDDMSTPEVGLGNPTASRCTMNREENLGQLSPIWVWAVGGPAYTVVCRLCG